MKKAIFILVCFLVLGCSTTKTLESQNSNYQIDLPIKDLSIDKLNNYYILDDENKIHRYDNSYQWMFTYANRLSGEIQSIDATNPQKIIAFIADFNRILTLDNTLAQINTIDLNSANFLDVSAVARSNDNQIWIFDRVEQQLVKINTDGEVLLQSNRLSDYNFMEISAERIIERDNIVALVDPENGILLFDNFGHYMRTIDGQNLKDVHIINNKLIYSKENQLIIEDQKGISRQILMTKKSQRLILSNGKVYEVFSNGMTESRSIESLIEKVKF